MDSPDGSSSSIFSKGFCISVTFQSIVPLSSCNCLLQETPEVVGPALGRAEPLWNRFTSRAKQIMADLPYYHQPERLGFQKSSGTCRMGLCNPTGRLGNDALGYSAETSTKKMGFGAAQYGSIPSPTSWTSLHCAI